MDAVLDVYDYLITQGLAGGSTGWDILRRRTMDEPVADQLVVLSEDGGPAPEIGTTAGIGDSAERDIGVHVKVRGAFADSDSSRAKAQAIYDALHGQLGATIGSTQYLRVKSRTPEPLFAGFDDKGRPLHTVSFLMLTSL